MGQRPLARTDALVQGVRLASPSLAERGDELALVAGVRSGDVAVFTALVESHVDELCRFAESFLHAPERAEEVVQDVFAALWELRASWSVTCGIRSYLFGAVRNRALSVRRRMRLESSASTLALIRPSRYASGVAGDTAAGVELGDLSAAIRAALDRLPDRCREAFRLTRDHQLSYAEVAEVMGISVKTVDAHVAKAVRIMREALSDHL